MTSNGVLVTGAQGLLGAAVWAALARRGIPAAMLPGRLADITPGSLEFGTVIHCAGAKSHRPGDWAGSNVDGTRALLRGLAGRVRVVFASSRAVYAPTSATEVDEESPTLPGDTASYGGSKRLAERAIFDSDHPCLVFRFPTLFGPRSFATNAPDFLTQALHKMLRGEPVVLFSPERDLDFLEVDTFANAIVDALPPGDHWNATYNVAGPRRCVHGCIERMAAMLKAASGTAPVVIRQPGPPSRAPFLNTAKFDRVFGVLRHPHDEDVFRDMLRVARASG